MSAFLRRAKMNKLITQGALALALLAGAALVSAPASANSVHDNGHFGGTWSRIGPSQHYDRHAWRGDASGPMPIVDITDRAPMPITVRRIMITAMARAIVGGPGVGFSIGVY